MIDPGYSRSKVCSNQKKAGLSSLRKMLQLGEIAFA